MSKRKYEALVGLEFPRDKKIQERIRKGEDIPWHLRGFIRRVESGETIEEGDNLSLSELLEANLVREVEQNGEV